MSTRSLTGFGVRMTLSGALFCVTVATSSGLLHAQTPPVPPRTIDQFQMEESEPIDPSAGGGMLYRYADSTSTRITVFIYPIPPRQLTYGPQHALVREKNFFVQGLAEGVRRGWYESYKVADDLAIDIPTARGNIPGLAVLVTASARNRAVVEAFYIFAIDSSFVKIRATMYPAPGTKPRLRVFVEDLATTLSARAR